MRPGLERRKEQGMEKKQGALYFFVVVIDAEPLFLKLLLLLLSLCVLLKGKEKAPGEGKSEMRGSGSSYIPLSALLPFAAFKSHGYTTEILMF